jgi:two-component system phosphate regulon sensor histidine kinase PhoR
MTEPGQSTLAGRLDTKLKLDMALFFGGNPDAMDSAASLATWAGYREIELDQALQELAAQGILKRSGGVYTLADDPETRRELAEFAAHYRYTRSGLEDLLETLERDRQRMAERIEELEISTQAIVASMAEGLVVVDPDMKLRFFNDAALEILPGDIGEHLGVHVEEAVPEPSLVSVLRESVTENRPAHGSMVRTSHKGVRHYLLNAKPVAGHIGAPYGYVCVLSDVTEIVELDQLKSDLISFVSHELRGPLTGVKSYADTLVLSGGSLPNEQREAFAQTISREIDRLARLLDGFLDISRIEAGRALEVNAHVFDPVALAREAIGIQQATLDRCPLSLRAEKDRLELVGDKDKVLQVLLNLLSNAVKYSPRGGDVTVTVADEANAVRFSVEDHGLGIDKSLFDQVFTPFYRVREPSTRGVRGTGLGLFLSRHLVEAHGGRLWVESEPGQGSAFHFTIPLRHAEAGGESDEEERSARSDRRGREDHC